MKKAKQILSIFLAVIMLVAVVPVMNVEAICCRKDYFDKSRYTLTGDMAYDVAVIAKSQKGMTCSDFGYSGVDYGAWCDEFVADCLENAGADDSIVAHGGTVADFENKMRDRGAYTVSSPKVGDLVFFTWSHVEIVTKVEDGTPYCAGGNNGSSPGSCKGERKISSVGSVRLYLRPNYPDHPSYVNLGDDFYAYFEHYRTATHLENSGSNVQLVSNGVDDNAPKQIWHFLRQSNGSYKIISAYDGQCLDLHLADATNGANVKVYEDNGNNAQRWFIFSSGSGYGVRSACGDVVLDCAGGYTEPGTNIQVYESNGSDAQIFNICKLSNAALCQTILNLGNDFYAYLIQDSAWKHLENTGSNVQIAAGGNDSKDPKQIWHFLRQSNGSYKIVSAYDGNCLDLHKADTSDGSNIKVYEDNGLKAQQWYIFGCGDGYALRTAMGTSVLDCENGSLGAGTNIQIFGFNKTVAQIFSIYYVSKDGITYSKPNKPTASTVSVASLGNADQTTTLSWTASQLKDSNFDSRSYTLTLTKDGHAFQTKVNITATSIDLTLPAGNYTAQVRAINTKYSNHYTDGNTISFTVKDAEPSSDPTNSTAPTTPTNPSNPTDPTQPTNPTNPTQSTNPTQPTTQQQQQQSGNCKYCGEVHTGFFGSIIGFFHSILALFGLHK